MSFKQIEQNQIVIILTVIFIISLFHPKTFKFFSKTILGRAFLLGTIGYISYINKYAGMLLVLCILIAFNNYEKYDVSLTNLYENFDTSGNTIDISGNNIASDIMQDKVQILKAKEDLLNAKLAALQKASNARQTAALSSSATTTTSTETFKSKEGFCMTDRETSIVRGKQSNTIPVLQSWRNHPDNVSPYDSAGYNEYSTF